MTVGGQQDHPTTVNRSDNLLNVVGDSDIMMFGYNNEVDSPDEASVVDLTCDDEVIGGIAEMVVTDDDSSSEGSPGPEAWVAFKYVPFCHCFFFLFGNQFVFPIVLRRGSSGSASLENQKWLLSTNVHTYGTNWFVDYLLLLFFIDSFH